MQIFEAYDLMNSKLIIGGVTMPGVIKVALDIEQEKTNNYAAGPKPYSRSRKQKQFKGSLGFFYRELVNLCRSANVNDLCEIGPFDVIFMAKGASNELATHTVKDVEFTSHKIDFSRGGDDTEVEPEILYSDFLVVYS